MRCTHTPPQTHKRRGGWLCSFSPRWWANRRERALYATARSCKQRYVVHLGRLFGGGGAFGGLNATLACQRMMTRPACRRPVDAPCMVGEGGRACCLSKCSMRLQKSPPPKEMVGGRSYRTRKGFRQPWIPSYVHLSTGCRAVCRLCKVDVSWFCYPYIHCLITRCRAGLHHAPQLPVGYDWHVVTKPWRGIERGLFMRTCERAAMGGRVRRAARINGNRDVLSFLLPEILDEE